jgi:Protein of unknown function (DUF3606)
MSSAEPQACLPVFLPLSYASVSTNKGHMSDSNDDMLSRDANRIGRTADDEMQYWVNVLGISQLKLEAEIKKHGNSAWLRKYRPPAASEAESGLHRSRPSAIAGDEIGFDPPQRPSATKRRREA